MEMEGVKIIVIHELLCIEPQSDAELRIIELCHDDLKVKGRAEFECELEVRRLDGLEKEAPWVSRQKGSDHVSQLDFFKCGPVNSTART
ncbi:hypothetical protein GOBAR_AA25532 [Gossypium barbadense]|uniref:Uncharacterized protein n=1 Tax=Gossypium barbadense TaxID=3634 RepID=A0A2P5WVM1_GOSBA|nr:hypothetical protein GOBAR_AA25532 [Gossypium barbadense]